MGRPGKRPEGLQPPILYADEDLVVIDKPAGLLVHPARGGEAQTVVGLLGGLLGGGEPGREGVVHRLDRDTSGLLVLARNQAAYAALREAIRRREVSREYIALAGGRLAHREGTVEAPIGRDPHAPTRRGVGGRGVREARTTFRVLALLPDTTLLGVRLHTGRTHQIRVHLAALGHPLVGDPLYGGAQLPGLNRQFLHAARLAFRHPRDGRALLFTSPLPADLAAALAKAQAAPVTIRRR